MPKAKYAERGKVKPKSVKSKGPATDKRRESQFGKKLKKGTNAASSVYIGRTKAVKKLQVTLRDFRRLCILKGIYPRDPKSKKSLDPHQTYYHFKDIQYLMHEPLMRKFRDQQVRKERVGREIVRAGRWVCKCARRHNLKTSHSHTFHLLPLPPDFSPPS
jgi:pescadillo protein